MCVTATLQNHGSENMIPKGIYSLDCSEYGPLDPQNHGSENKIPKGIHGSDCSEYGPKDSQKLSDTIIHQNQYNYHDNSILKTAPLNLI